MTVILPGCINAMSERKEAGKKGIQREDGLGEEEHAWHFSGRVGKVVEFPSQIKASAMVAWIVLDGGVSRKDDVYPEMNKEHQGR